MVVKNTKTLENKLREKLSMKEDVAAHTSRETIPSRKGTSACRAGACKKQIGRVADTASSRSEDRR